MLTCAKAKGTSRIMGKRDSKGQSLALGGGGIQCGIGAIHHVHNGVYCSWCFSSDESQAIPILTALLLPWTNLYKSLHKICTDPKCALLAPAMNEFEWRLK